MLKREHPEMNVSSYRAVPYHTVREALKHPHSAGAQGPVGDLPASARLTDTKRTRH